MVSRRTCQVDLLSVPLLVFPRFPCPVCRALAVQPIPERFWPPGPAHTPPPPPREPSIRAERGICAQRSPPPEHRSSSTGGANLVPPSPIHRRRTTELGANPPNSAPAGPRRRNLLTSHSTVTLTCEHTPPSGPPSLGKVSWSGGAHGIGGRGRSC